MKTLLLTTNYNGQDFHLLLPDEANGVAFGWLVPNEQIKQAVDLTPVGGKGQYGDLSVSLIDLKCTPAKDVQTIVENTNLELFKPLLQELEIELLNYMEELTENDEMEEVYVIEGEQRDLWKAFGVENEEGKTEALNVAYMKQVNEFMEDKMTTTIEILASEAEQIKELMLKNGFTLI